MAFTQFGSSMQTVRYRTLASGSYSNISSTDYRLANDAATLENYWRRELRQASSIPTVDFNKDRVAIFFIGQRKSGGYTVSIRGIYKNADSNGMVMLNEMTPAEGSVQTMALTQPWVMVAVERSILDFSLNISQVQTPPPSPWIPIGPTISVMPLPWNPCFQGYGGSWGSPCGYMFDDWNSFSRWGFDNDLNFYSQSPNINWANQRLACVSAGRWGLGFDVNVLGVQLRGNVAVVQISRTETNRVSGRGAPFQAIAVQRTAQQIQVELVESRKTCFVGSGDLGQNELASHPRPGAFLMNSSRSTETYFGQLYPLITEKVRKHDYKSGPLAVAYLGRMASNYEFSRVVYRGNQAILQFAPAQSQGQSQGISFPYVAVRLERGVTAVTLEEVARQRRQ
jgi:hypothetical protein